MSESEQSGIQTVRQVADLRLEIFQHNNPECKLSIEGECLVIQNPWGSNECRISFSLSDTIDIGQLNTLIFPTQLNAIIHIDTNEIEFIYGYLLPDEEPTKSHINRSFNIHFEGQRFGCRFAEPTDLLLKIAKRTRWLPTEPGEMVVSQLRAFRDFQRLDKLPDRAREYFGKRVPRNFFLKADKPIQSLALDDIAHHINFIMYYYDRRSPIIDIRQESGTKHSEKSLPMRFCEGSFPSSMVLNRIDDLILQLITVARGTNARFAFIYYYQVIEYAGFYFMDERVRKTLKRVLKDPLMINCPNDKIQELFSVFCDTAQNDESRMKKVIEECCDPKVLWLDIVNDKVFFSKAVDYDGGFSLSPLISQDTTEDSWVSMWMPKLFDQITKIRNCLVHARERRQSNVILPTKTNAINIERYLPLIARIAEQIALKND